MDANDVRKYLDGDTSVLTASQPEDKHDDTNPTDIKPDDASGNEEPKPNETGSSEPDSTEHSPNGGTQETANPEEKPKGGKEELPPDVDPKKLPYPKPKPNDPAQYKANKAFIHQKQKFKAKVSGLENQIAQLKAKLAKYESVDPDSVPDDQKESFKLDKHLLKHDLENLDRSRQQAYDEFESEQADAIHQSRIERCFSDPAEAESYSRLLENGRDKFVQFLAQYDPENAVLQYLDDTDNSPLMVRLLMTRPDVLKRVIEKRNPISKAIELRSIENQMMMSRKLRQTSPKTPNQATKQTPTQVATTGRVVGASGANAPKAPKTRAEWNDYLASHP